MWLDRVVHRISDSIQDIDVSKGKEIKYIVWPEPIVYQKDKTVILVTAIILGWLCFIMIDQIVASKAGQAPWSALCGELVPWIGDTRATDEVGAFLILGVTVAFSFIVSEVRRKLTAFFRGLAFFVCISNPVSAALYGAQEQVQLRSSISNGYESLEKARVFGLMKLVSSDSVIIGQIQNKPEFVSSCRPHKVGFLNSITFFTGQYGICDKEKNDIEIGETFIIEQLCGLRFTNTFFVHVRKDNGDDVGWIKGGTYSGKSALSDRVWTKIKLIQGNSTDIPLCPYK